MQLKHILHVVLLLSGSFAYAQSDSSALLLPFKNKELWGYKNNSGQVIVKPKYDTAWAFSGSNAIVVYKSKTGCIDINGKEIIPCLYDEVVADTKYPHLLKVSKDSLFGVFSNKGDLIADCNYSEVKFNKYGVLLDSAGLKGMSDFSGKLFLSISYDNIYDFYDSLALVKKNNRFGIVDNAGNVVVPCEYNKILWNKKKNNYFPGGKALVEKNGKFGILGKNGEIIVPCQYDWEFYLPVISSYTRVVQNNMKGLIDKTGSQVLPCVYDEVNWNYDTTKNTNIPANLKNRQLFLVKKNKKWGVVNDSNNIVIPLKYEDIESFTEDLAAAKLNGKWGYIDFNDSLVIPFHYDFCKGFENNLAIAGFTVTDIPTGKTISKAGLINKKGEEVLSFDYSITYLKDEEVYILSTGDNKMGVATKYGKIFIMPQFKLTAFWDSWASEGMIKVFDSDSKKYGFYSKNGKLIIPIEYDEAGLFSNGLVYMKKDSLWGYLNKTGKEIIDFRYEEVNSFSNNLALVKRNGLYGYINTKGDEIIPPRYKQAGNFANGYSRIMENDFYGIIDSTGREVIPAIQENILFNTDNQSYFTNGLALVQHDDLFGYYNTSGELVIPYTYKWADYFSDEKAVVVDTSGNYRYISKDGNFAFEESYDKAFSFYKGTAIVKSGKTYLIIDTTGKPQSTLPFDEVKPFIDGPAAVRQGKSWGYIDEKGNIVLPLKFERAASFRNGEAQVELDGATYKIDLQGEITGQGVK